MSLEEDKTNRLVSVIIPAYNAAEQLSICLDSLRSSTCKSLEIIVVDDGSTDSTVDVARSFGVRVVSMACQSGPAAARNHGARLARGEFLAFFDTDVVVHPRTISRLVRRLKKDATCAAAFGSYDESPAAQNLASQFRNLLHHHVHQTSSDQASTFWTGCGVIRRSVFVELGGFDVTYRRPSIEDIELGCRLRTSGYRIVLEKRAQVTHLKRWTVSSMLACDLRDRGIPWTQLLIRQGSLPNDLNLKYSQRISVLCSLAFVLALVAACWHVPATLLLPTFVCTLVLIADWVTGKEEYSQKFAMRSLLALAVLGIVGVGGVASTWTFLALAMLIPIGVINGRFYRFLSRLHGPLFALLAFPLHVAHFLTCGLAFTSGILLCVPEALSRWNGARLRPRILGETDSN